MLDAWLSYRAAPNFAPPAIPEPHTPTLTPAEPVEPAVLAPDEVLVTTSITPDVLKATLAVDSVGHDHAALLWSFASPPPPSATAVIETCYGGLWGLFG